MKLYALHPDQLIDLDIGAGHTFAAGFLFVLYETWAKDRRANRALERRELDPVREQWRNRAKPKLVVVQHELSDTFRDGCEVRTWPGGTAVSTYEHRMGGQHLGTLVGDEGSWRLNAADESELARVRAQLEHYYRRRALRVLAGVAAPGP